jgi:hypothetical protein
LLGPGIIAITVVPDAAAAVTEQLDRIAADVGAGAVIAGAYGPFEAQRVDPRRRDATAHQFTKSLFSAVTLNLISINTAGWQPD